MRSFGRMLAVAVAVCGATLVIDVDAQQDAATLYAAALERESAAREELASHAEATPDIALLRRIRSVVASYEDVVRRFPRSAYSDNALWRAGVLAADAFRQFGDGVDRTTAFRLFTALKSEYPSSSLNGQVAEHAVRLNAARAPNNTPSVLRAIRRDVLLDALRITLEFERETAFREERLDGPPRVFVDLPNTSAVDGLKDARLSFPDDVVRQIRVGRQIDSRIRVVLDLQGAGRHSVYSLYNPYRLVIDVERTPPPAAIAGRNAPGATWTAPAAARPVAPIPDVSVAPNSNRAATPSAPSSNTAGGFSLSRQLGLGVARVVIDPGHGGHDPGAQVRGLNEADLVLDIAVRLEALLSKEPGVEVVLTRRTNVYVALEERTAIANRENADVFLSIHANASANATARGVETYFLNFAPNPAAEAIAARENAGSARTMNSLPDIVKAIALNNKIDESRDVAEMVQAALYDRLRRADRNARNLGVKQAPFMVLIGATMPSVLAEVAFITNPDEATRLRTTAYRQQIAEALFNGVMKYQQSLKKPAGVATK